jgi:CPA2 family monovalent cation:H+ antiporter-2
MVIAETQYKHQVVADMTPFRDILLGVFFITVGIQVDPIFVTTNFPRIVAVMLVLLSVKSLVAFAIVRFFNGARTALKTALLLAQSGEFSFVVFETAHANGLFVDPERSQLLIMSVVMTMMLTPFIFRYLDLIVFKILREPEQGAGSAEDEPEPWLELDEQQIVICGYGALGQRVGERLDAEGIPFVAIEHDGSSFRASRAKGLPVYFGNAASRQFLEKINIDNARAVVIAMSNEPRILLVAHSVRAMTPDVPIMVCVSNARLCKELTDIGVAEPVDSIDRAAAALVEQLVSLELLPESDG